LPTAQGRQRKLLENAGKTQGISKFGKIHGKQGICMPWLQILSLGNIVLLPNGYTDG
jgi:hypothetical protein